MHHKKQETQDEEFGVRRRVRAGLAAQCAQFAFGHVVDRAGFVHVFEICEELAVGCGR